MKSIAIIFAFALLNASFARAGNGEISDATELKNLQPETSIFLISEIKLPTDGLEKRVVEKGSAHRVDYFQNGNRIAFSDLKKQTDYCSITSSLFADHTETIKRLEIVRAVQLNLERGIRAVAIEIASVQDTALDEMTCYQGETAQSPLTVGTLRNAFGKNQGVPKIALLAPLGRPSSSAAAVGSPPSEEKKTPSVPFREALTASEGDPTEHADSIITNLRESHKAYVRHIKYLKDDQIVGEDKTEIPETNE